MIAFAQTTLSKSSNLGNVVSFIISIIALILPVLVGIAFLTFLFGLIKFIIASGDEKSHAQGKSFMIWSLVALFVLVSFMGILAFFTNDLGVNSSNFLNSSGIPVLPTTGTI